MTSALISQPTSIATARRSSILEAASYPAATDERLEPHALRKGDVLIGTSPEIQSVHHAIELAARSELPVMIQGDSGTGKELVARIIHALSRRRTGPVVAINCAALPADLFESELFGHVRGAFTGAHHDHEGVFARADGGTLLLDEVAELKLEHQAKLLRAIQFSEIRPVGGDPRSVDVRIVCATHRDLRAEVKAGRFREDLFYRLRVVPVRMPALRERRGDIPLLAQHLLSLHAGDVTTRFIGFTPEALMQLEEMDWPGNVRELANIVQRAMLVSDGPMIDIQHLPIESVMPPPRPSRIASTALPQSRRSDPPVDLEQGFSAQKKALVERFERRYAEAMLDATGGNISEAARRAGVDRKSFWKLLRRLGLGDG